MLEHFTKEIHDYCADHSVRHSDYLDRIEESTKANVYGAGMISSAYQGRLLSMLSHLVNPRRVLEIGTFTGYSALCMAEGLTADGKVISIERNKSLKPIIDQHLSWTPLGQQVEVLYGEAHLVIPQLTAAWDMVFVDAAKKQYGLYVDLIIDQLRPGGLIIADNVLWRGKVLEEDSEDDRTLAMQQFNDRMHGDERLQPFLLPIRDGIFILRKK
ncbi:O-methyltransferase [Membranihabitans marinus]|uniref:O-methyltransferase n=1 Tax=Membranihabitans marinus TaxID=1227546 RepID=UPI001F1A7696|nr:O-methyltransferase [Membranihabitans marinus]